MFASQPTADRKRGYRARARELSRERGGLFSIQTQLARQMEPVSVLLLLFRLFIVGLGTTNNGGCY